MCQVFRGVERHGVVRDSRHCKSLKCDGKGKARPEATGRRECQGSGPEGLVKEWGRGTSVSLSPLEGCCGKHDLS